MVTRLYVIAALHHVFDVSDKQLWTEELGYTNLGTEQREQKIEAIKSLLRTLGVEHPEVFEGLSITPQDYQRELKDAIFSLGGELRQEHGADNEDTVQEIFLDPAEDGGVLSYVDQRGNERIDFKGRLSATDETFAIDVKGGEGQSIGHLLVPSNTDLVMLWSERNARNTKSPASRLNEVINRAVRWGFNQDENVALMVIRDEPAGARTEEGRVIPDVVVFPEYFPTPENPDPPLRNPKDLHFIEVLYDTLAGEGKMDKPEIRRHIWQHDLRIRPDSDGYLVKKSIWNWHNPSIKLKTQSIDYQRISQV